MRNSLGVAQDTDRAWRRIEAYGASRALRLSVERKREARNQGREWTPEALQALYFTWMRGEAQNRRGRWYQWRIYRGRLPPAGRWAAGDEGSDKSRRSRRLPCFLQPLV